MLFNKQNGQFFTQAGSAAHNVNGLDPVIPFLRGGSSFCSAIQSKKFYAVDLQRKVWFGGTGEMKDTDI